MAAQDDIVFSEDSINKTTNYNRKDLYNWKLVTNDFMEASKDLELGELLHDNMFGLFEAMSAIEMMDPKMDAGMAKAGNIKRRKPLSFNEAIEKKVLPWDSITAPDFITNFDHTMACFVTWLEGHSLAQTVFTNLVRLFTCLLLRPGPGYITYWYRSPFHLLRRTVFWYYILGSWLFFDDTNS